jgi:hypothetical protein
MAEENKDQIHSFSQNDHYIRIEKNTAWIVGLIIGALIFVSNIFGTWMLQNKDITTLTTAVSAITVDQKLQDNKISQTSERTAVIENSYKIMNDNVCTRIDKLEGKVDSIINGQEAYYKSQGFKIPKGVPK